MKFNEKISAIMDGVNIKDKVNAGRMVIGYMSNYLTEDELEDTVRAIQGMIMEYYTPEVNDG